MKKYFESESVGAHWGIIPIPHDESDECEGFVKGHYSGYEILNNLIPPIYLSDV